MNTIQPNDDYIHQIQDIIQKCPYNYSNIIRAKKNKHLHEYILQWCDFLDDPKFEFKTKIWYALNKLKDFVDCKNESCTKKVTRNIWTIHTPLLSFCCEKCRYESSLFRNAVKTAVLSFSEEKKQLKVQRRKQTCKEQYGDENYTNREQAIETCKERYDGAINVFQVKEIKDKCSDTKLLKYGNTHYNNAKKISQTYSNKPQNEIDLKTEQQRISYKEKTGFDFPMQNPVVKKKFSDKIQETLIKINATKKKRGTFNSSSSEKLIFEHLCKLFPNDVEQQYLSDKYPFNCDFYIKSLDLYIECNFHWTHGGHFFDASNLDDQAKVQKWKDKGTKFYDNAIKTWTVRDLKKCQTALDNSLNYLVFWSMQEFLNWIQQLPEVNKTITT